MPVIVPHVPAPATKWVIRPPVWRHSSGPVVLLVGQRVVRVGVLVGAERVALDRSAARRPCSSSCGSSGGTATGHTTTSAP